MTATAAPAQATCSPLGHRCAADNGRPATAVHTVAGRHLCGYHSPYDVVEANGKTQMENYLEAFDARQAAREAEQEAQDTPAETVDEAAGNEAFDAILVLEHTANEARTMIDSPAGHYSRYNRTARTTMWRQAQHSLETAIDGLSDDELNDYAAYRRRFR